jgi:hypothetical protein
VSKGTSCIINLPEFQNNPVKEEVGVHFKFLKKLVSNTSFNSYWWLVTHCINISNSLSLAEIIYSALSWSLDPVIFIANSQQASLLQI